MNTLLIGILALIATSSANSQIKLLNDSKAVKLSSVREKSNFKAGLGKIDSDYFINYRDVKYKTMSSIEIIKIGEVDKLKEFKQSIFKVIKSNESSAFKFDGKTFSLIPHKSKGAYINILDKYIKYEMGYWSLKKLEKLIPGSELD